MCWLARLVVGGLLVLFGSVFVVAPGVASAECDCGRPSTADIDAAPAAARGTILGQGDDLWVVDVTGDIKGNLPGLIAIRTVDDDDCELGWVAGRDISVVLDIDDDGILTADGCSKADPGLLSAWSPARGAAGPVDVIAAGQWGTFRLLAAGPDGQPVAFGYEPGRVDSLAICPDAQRMVETATLADGSTELVVRSLVTFEPEIRSGLRTPQGGPVTPTDLRCADAEASEVLLLIDDQTHRLEQGVVAADPSTPWPADTASRTPARGSAEVQAPYDQAVDLAVEPTTAPIVLRSAPEPPATFEELVFATPPPSTGGWSGWLVILIALGGGAYLVRKATDPEWRASWTKPNNGRNSIGRRREDATGPGRFT